MTVGLPTWGNRDIIWLPMEGLCRQETDKEWELIVMECDSFDNVGFEGFRKYWPRLQKVGCKRLLYMFCGTRLPLGQKWKEMALRSSYGMFILQGSDDYPFYGRVQATKSKEDWYDQRYLWMYSLKSRKLIKFDKNTIDVWKTGGNMAVKTDILKSIPDNDMRKGVDHFIHSHVGGHYTDDKIYGGGLCTSGANSISVSREMFFKKPQFPYVKTELTIDDMELPKDIVERLKDYEFVDRHQKLKSHKVSIRFVKDYEKFRKGHEMELTAAAFYNLSEYLEAVNWQRPESFEKELI